MVVYLTVGAEGEQEVAGLVPLVVLLELVSGDRTGHSRKILSVFAPFPRLGPVPNPYHTRPLSISQIPTH